MHKHKLTIGMATYDDFDGVYFSVQALRIYHPACEIVVIDNAPHTPASRMLAPFCASAGAKYVAMPEPVGTSAPRNRVFDEATSDVVMCIDSHVLLLPGAIERLIAWYDAHPDCPDLVSGPLVYDDLGSYATHFDDVWRGEMWGIWGQAWQCRCPTLTRSASEETEKPLRFTSIQDDRLTHCQFRELATGVPVTHCPRCGHALPEALPFAGSAPELEKLGYYRLGSSADDPVFEAPGQGLGLFACRRDAWLRFNAEFRGFGGEEMYIHEKYRRAGRKNLILPFLRWGHRFGRPRGTPYPDSRYNKIRNYVLGHLELGLDLRPVEEHFVDSGLMPPSEWEMLAADPVGATRDTVAAAVAALPQPYGQMSADQLLAFVKSIPRDLDQHLDELAALASHCHHVTEFSGRRESAIAFLAGIMRGGGNMLSHNTERDPLLEDAAYRHGDRFSLLRHDSPDVPSISETDLLFLDTKHTASRLREEITKFAPAVRRWIVVHDTQIYGTNGEDGQPGLLTAIVEFLESHPEWFVASHTPKQYGLTVLSRDEADRPAEPVRLVPVGKGPGTELKALLRQLGIMENPTCDCNRKADQMDAWGIDGCRTHFDEIVGWMREGQGKWGWKDKLAAAAKAVKTGIAFKVNWADPFPGLIELAIQKAEEPLFSA